MRINPFVEIEYDSHQMPYIIQNYEHKIIVRIMLYFAKDCLDFIYSVEAEYCIYLVDDWLKDESSVDREKLRIAHVRNVDKSFRHVAANAAHAACYQETSLGAALGIFPRAIKVFPQNKRADKEQEYLSYSRMFAHQDELWNRNFTFIPFQFNQPSTAAEVAMFLDQLEENYQDRKVFTFDNFIYNSDFELNLPRGYSLKGQNKLDLVKKISKSRFAIDYLNHLYGS